MVCTIHAWCESLHAIPALKGRWNESHQPEETTLSRGVFDGGQASLDGSPLSASPWATEPGPVRREEASSTKRNRLLSLRAMERQQPVGRDGTGGRRGATRVAQTAKGNLAAARRAALARR